MFTRCFHNSDRLSLYDGTVRAGLFQRSIDSSRQIPASSTGVRCRHNSSRGVCCRENSSVGVICREKDTRTSSPAKTWPLRSHVCCCSCGSRSYTVFPEPSFTGTGCTRGGGGGGDSSGTRLSEEPSPNHSCSPMFSIIIASSDKNCLRTCDNNVPPLSKGSTRWYVGCSSFGCGSYTVSMLSSIIIASRTRNCFCTCDNNACIANSSFIAWQMRGGELQSTPLKFRSLNSPDTHKHLTTARYDPSILNLHFY